MATYPYTAKAEAFGSSSIDSLHYDEPTKTLYVEFPNGTIIGYKDVPISVWNGIRSASSKGSYYSREVRGRYHGMGEHIDYHDLVERSSGLESIGMTPQAFTISGVAKITRKVVAPTMEAAIEQFKADNPGATVTEVTVSFV